MKGHEVFEQKISELGMTPIDISLFHLHDAFDQLFPLKAGGQFFSGQLWVLKMLSQYFNVSVGPMCGALDGMAFMGVPTTMWTSSDSFAHPRMLRLTSVVPWWTAVEMGSMNELKAGTPWTSAQKDAFMQGVRASIPCST